MNGPTPDKNTAPDGWVGFSVDLMAPGGTALDGGIGADGMSASPDGGTFVLIGAAIGGFDYQEYIRQTLTGLTVGEPYSLSFWWGNGGWQNYTSGFPTDTRDSGVIVEIAGVVFTTDLVAHEGFGSQTWRHESFTFDATATSHLLEVKGNSSHSGLDPRFGRSAVDGIQLNVVPEPSSATLVALGLLALARRRRVGDGVR